ncbi:hypothetical protein OKJ48_42255 [Streptomyces kunmingensis]|uniref:Uncharacterized protein n=1 Tax=Streptomyces kunmingensis TaxID=68225 RepID=A0ABU6CS96_9ACTN|nr:hypothetical protein [Streptomyces kunmingensis]MEB3966811.1 hypothetical protein [Streptomyces kunmingensis]
MQNATVTDHRDVTTNRTRFYTYRLGRSQLDRLFSIASEGLNPDRTTLATERAGTRFVRPTLEDLVSAVAASQLPGDLSKLDNIEFSGFGGQDRYIRISIEPLWLNVSISGQDATWVHGQAARLKALLEPNAGTVNPSDLRLRAALKLSILAATLAGVAGFLFGQGILHQNHRQSTALATLVAVIMYSIVFFTGTAGGGKAKAIINVAGEIPERARWWDTSMSDKISLSGVAIAALAAIAAGVSAYADISG